jgi:hypothetical protein
MQNDNSAERERSLDLATSKSALARRVHQLNNLLTAFHCLWDVAVAQLAKSPGSSSTARELEEVVEQLTTQFRALQQDATKLISHVEANSQLSASSSDLSSFNHCDDPTHSADRASESRATLPDTLKESS